MNTAHLIVMANQIARNFAAQGEDAAVAAVVQHIEDFWDPRMKAAIVAATDRNLDPIAQRAIGQLEAMH